ncbi:hypothetical protein QE152_g29126 [Popillia japonica]|uniref:Uncharacterized protein n=1 Tax=Popillia japonica TaxID=7064 RepID=A0AAW1JKF5_POPJA
MYRTPPKTQSRHSFLPLPDSPADGHNNNNPSPPTPEASGNDNEEDTPTPRHSGSSAGDGTLTDDQILEQIRSLQQLLEQRRKDRVTSTEMGL